MGEQEKEGSKKTGIKKFTAILDKPIFLAGEGYTTILTIRDSEVHQDLSFELKLEMRFVSIDIFLSNLSLGIEFNKLDGT